MAIDVNVFPRAGWVAKAVDQSGSPHIRFEGRYGEGSFTFFFGEGSFEDLQKAADALNGAMKTPFGAVIDPSDIEF